MQFGENLKDSVIDLTLKPSGYFDKSSKIWLYANSLVNFFKSHIKLIPHLIDYIVFYLNI